MTTIEFMQNELNKCKINLEQQIARNAPANNIENLRSKIFHYEIVCELLNRRVDNA